MAALGAYCSQRYAREQYLQGLLETAVRELDELSVKTVPRYLDVEQQLREDIQMITTKLRENLRKLKESA